MTDAAALAWPDHLLTLAEWEALPEDTDRQLELVEGVLVVAPKPLPMHQRFASRLATRLDEQLPRDVCALSDVEIVIEAQGPATVRAPDVIVVPTALAEKNLPRQSADQVLLAIEILSPGTVRTDRIMKLVEYAQAGIGRYWIIDLGGAEPTVTAFVLRGEGYQTAGEWTGLVEISPPAAPAPVWLDLPRLLAR